MLSVYLFFLRHPLNAQVRVEPQGAKVVSWDFDELRELLAANHHMSVCFHAALASAMASKLVDTHNPAIKYRQMLKVRMEVTLRQGMPVLFFLKGLISTLVAIVVVAAVNVFVVVFSFSALPAFGMR